MSWKNERKYRIVCAYDTETTNIGSGADTRAFPILYICNDLRNIDLATYTVGKDSDIRFYRHTSEMLEYIDLLVGYGEEHGFVPVVCAYNLMFDMQSLMDSLSRKYMMKVNAQTATSVYTLDLTDETGKVTLLRFWDTFYLEQGGLKAMGETCGVPKAVGDWDYSLIRTPGTPLSETEKYYAGRDTEVIPAYLKYLCDANDWLKPDDLGVRVLTKTSIVRQMAYHKIGPLSYRNSHNARVTLLQAFETTCKQELPDSFDVYALRKACFRGGLTFTSANYASRVMHNVASLDVTSMHHTFINGAMIPVHFRKVWPNAIHDWCERIMFTDKGEVMSAYNKPFEFAFHARIVFHNLRMRKGTPYDRYGIAIIPEGKFKNHAGESEYSRNDASRRGEELIRMSGWKDKAYKPMFAYGKLMKCDKCILHINEIEFWNICQVYEFDSFDVILGEGTTKFQLPPDYVTLQSNQLFEQKSDVKCINKRYVEGVPYTDPIPNSIPADIAADVRKGSLSKTFLSGWYNSTIKGMFNGIYGTMAQDVFKPDFTVIGGNIKVDKVTETTPDNFDKRKPKKCRVLYTYGMRIVGRSRMHLLIAISLLYDAFGTKVIPTGGDTDSIKAACAKDVTDASLKAALRPIEVAADFAISATMRRVRRLYPKSASNLLEIGHFDIEPAEGGSTRWRNHYEGWNKARVSESNGHVHVTCAGLSRPEGAYHIENAFEDLLAAGYDFGQIAGNTLGFDVFVDNSICHSLQKHQPDIGDVYDGNVTDYLGNMMHVNVPEAIALYPSGRWLGETTKRATADNLQYMRNVLHRLDVDIVQKNITLYNDEVRITRLSEYGDELICHAKASQVEK